MSNSLDTLLSYVAIPDEGISPVMVIANQKRFSDQDYAQVPLTHEVEQTAREVGEYIGKQEVVESRDVDVLTEILFFVVQMALDTENALIVKDNGTRNQEISNFFKNALDFTEVFILQPMIASMREHDVNSNTSDFQKICNTILGMWSSTLEDVSAAAYEATNNRLLKVFDKVFQ